MERSRYTGASEHDARAKCNITAGYIYSALFVPIGAQQTESRDRCGFRGWRANVLYMRAVACFSFGFAIFVNSQTENQLTANWARLGSGPI